MLGFHQRHEGEKLQPGVNYSFDQIAGCVILKLGRVVVYARRRTDYMMRLHRYHPENYGGPGNVRRWSFAVDVIPINLSILPENQWDWE